MIITYPALKIREKIWREKIAAIMSDYHGKSDSNFVNVFYTKLRLEYMLSTKINYVHESNWT